ncbi:MAG: hypothetical protein JW821_16945 [Deltaproteobacteria bacterium]|nr:hypothetical protein [Deltaproteobacteria bacterium]
METFAKPKEFVENPYYQDQRQKTLAGLSDGMIDTPIIDLIRAFNALPHCFTLQSCCGHFVFAGQKDPSNLDPLPITDTLTGVEYRIAYVALCIEDSDSGRRLLDALKEIPSLDPENIQFCCAEWFWKMQVNSYALQVEPDRFKDQDTAMLDYREALRIEKVRDAFFARLRALVEVWKG